MATVQLDGIRKIYPNGYEAVKRLDLSIESGEFIALLGPSGCGKTTTLRMVAGLEDISEGELRIDDRRANEMAPQDRNVAMVFQSYALYPHMSAFDNMAFGLKIQKLPADEIKRRIEDAAVVLGIDKVLDRKPGQMSGGQRQRVAMGRAMVRRPAVFLFDEPLSNLDARLRTHMRMELARIHRDQGVTSLYVTHDQVEAMTLSDRICLMKDGDVQQIGPPMDLYRTPANTFVAGFIGQPNMNLGSAQIDGGALMWAGVPFPLIDGFDGPQSFQLGIRPQDLTISPTDGSDDAAFTVQLVEPTGHETVVHIRRDDCVLRVLLTGDERPMVGAIVRPSFGAQGIHCFESESGLRI